MLTEREKWLMEQAWEACDEGCPSLRAWLADFMDDNGSVTVETQLAKDAPRPTWTSEPPTVEGWYWWRETEQHAAKPRWWKPGSGPGTIPFGQWQGPLEPPE